MSLLDRFADYAKNTAQGLIGDIVQTIATPTQQAQDNPQNDWRVRLSLAPNSNYLYNAPYSIDQSDTSGPGILAPLRETNGVIFPYTPAITVSYNANYDSPDITHSNYKIYQYKNSAVEQITITCDFTAQDTYEANYILAVIHFFRSATKMFYGQDQDPQAGTPPPLCFLTGMGAYQFDQHPLVITNFTYNLPADVDYIRAGINAAPAGTLGGIQPSNNQGETNTLQRIGSLIRLAGRILPGGNPSPTVFSIPAPGTGEGTYVPTKIQMQITALPVVSRNEISTNFSVKDYATGKLLRGSRRNGGGMW
jgi:hypothetical protein